MKNLTHHLIEQASARISRRHFLGTTAALSAGLALSSGQVLAQGTSVLRARSNSDIQNIDPINPAATADQNVMQAIFNRLVNFKPGTAWEWELDAAEKIDVVDDTHVRFKLRPNIMWTNGFGEMTTEDVKYSFERHARLESWTAVDWAALKEVQIVDKYNGVIVLNEPFAPLFWSTLPYGSGTIVCKKAVEKLEGERFSVTPPATSGPYKIKQWTPKQKMILDRHAGWNGPKPAYDEIHIFPIEDEKTAEIGFQAGELDITKVAVSSVGRFKENMPANTNLIERPPLRYEWIGMNVDFPPLDDARVRKAIQLAIDVEEIIDVAYFGVPERATGIIAPGLIGHRPTNIYRGRNVDAARKLLEKAGHGSGLSLKIATQNKTDHLSVCQVAQAHLAEVGVKLQIDAQDTGTFWILGIEAEGEFWKDLQLIYNGYNMAPDPYWATAWFVPDQIGEWNWERWNSPEYGRLHEEALRETDPRRRHDLYVMMQDMMEESGAYIFITHGANAYIYGSKIKPGLAPNGEVFLFRQFAPA